MAKIVIEFDTVDKTMSASVDGKAVADVVEAYVSKRYSMSGDGDDEVSYGCSITTMAEDEESDIRTMTRLCASESLEGQRIIAAEGPQKSPVDGFVIVDKTSSLQKDIASFLGK